MNELAPVASEPLLRTLSPALRGLERQLRSWLDTQHRYPISTLQKAALEGLAADLQRQADALQLERPLLIIVLMGGTGVGKSTLLNALAGGDIAQASFTRPTTRDPVVYYHESLQPHKLDASLRLCKLGAHSRPALEQKILVDTPDIDSNDLANREKLLQILPVADIVLYVGSQEKYHDQVGWELFLEQRKRRAFAFVLNKWDRCLHPGATGARPDEDLLHDLQGQGFESPMLFRTNAQYWVDHPDKVRDTAEPPPVEGEQFRDLLNWLEKGLNRLEVEAIKAHGVSQMLRDLEQKLDAVRPPDLTAVAQRTREVWRKTLAEEARADATVLLNTLEPYQKEVEHHFAMERQHLFRGPMATYLQLGNKIKYLGSTLRDRIPFAPKVGSRVETTTHWDLAAFTMSCSKAASEKHLDARNRALANRLVNEGNTQGFLVELLCEPTEATAKLDWSGRHAQAISEVMGQIETVWTRPTGLKRFVQGTVIFLANYLPVMTFVLMIILLAGRYFWEDVFGKPGDAGTTLSYLLLPPFLVMILLHLLISFVLPLHWKAIRMDLETHLEKKLEGELDKAYGPIPDEVAKVLLLERQGVDRLAGEVREVTGWLEKSEKSASIHELYGN